MTAKPMPLAWITGSCIVSVKRGVFDLCNQPNTSLKTLAGGTKEDA